MAKSITVSVVVTASAEKVWRCFNDPGHITKWAFASPDWEALYAHNDVREGGAFVIKMAAKDGSAGFDFSGVYTGVVPQEKITYTMDDGRTVVVEFETVEGGIRVSQLFEMEDENPEEMQRAGWQAILNNFKQHCESEVDRQGS